jgi:hypothetical protein
MEPIAVLLPTGDAFRWSGQFLERLSITPRIEYGDLLHDTVSINAFDHEYGPELQPHPKATLTRLATTF